MRGQARGEGRGARGPASLCAATTLREADLPSVRKAVGVLLVVYAVLTIALRPPTAVRGVGWT
ncbi:MAG TPA: hypothetical protein VE528_06450 [Thermoleophilaceae bacterium]|nr:hypothetical protein [Thermoleophilaceae bacterium]